MDGSSCLIGLVILKVLVMFVRLFDISSVVYSVVCDEKFV